MAKQAIPMIRITLAIPAEMHTEIAAAAAVEDVTMTEWIRGAISSRLRAKEIQTEPKLQPIDRGKSAFFDEIVKAGVQFVRTTENDETEILQSAKGKDEKAG